MEEKILAQSKHYNIASIAKKILIVVFALCIAITSIAYINDYRECAQEYNKELNYVKFKHKYNYVDYYTYPELDCIHGTTTGYMTQEQKDRNLTKIYTKHQSLASYLSCSKRHSLDDFCSFDDAELVLIVCLIVFGSILVLLGLIYLWLASYSLTVTDRRIYGKTTFGKRVDLPIDKISAIGTSLLKGIAVGTSSGKIKFIMIKNHHEVHKTMSELLLERQEKANKVTTSMQIQSNNADELKKFKELFDMGAITQEEFESKKKQLLGL